VPVALKHAIAARYEAHWASGAASHAPSDSPTSWIADSPFEGGSALQGERDLPTFLRFAAARR